MSQDLTRDDYAEQLNTKFNIHLTPEIVVESELIEVSELRKRVRQEAYSLLFLVPAEFAFEQAAYRLEHPVLGSLILFMVPVGSREQGIEYEVLFNRLTDN